MATDVVDLQGFREHLNYTGPDDDPKAKALALHLEAAIEKVEDLCGPLNPRQVTGAVDTDYRGRVLLPWWPVLSIDEVLIGGRPQYGAAVDAAGILDLGRNGYDRLVLKVTVGRRPIPASLVLATYIVGSHLWETQRGRSGRPELFGGSEATDVPDVPRGFAIPARARELMAAHRLFDLA